MNTDFEISDNTTVEWYTPPEIIRPLGEFDLDPCTSGIAYSFNHSAKKYYTKEDDGLSKEWFGRVWLNPPYNQPTITQFMERMALHNNGIALLYNRSDNQMFHSFIFPVADSIFFIKGRIRFYKPDGTRGGQPGAGSVLIAFGENNTKAIEDSGLIGHIFKSVNKKVALQTSLIF
ncbi:MAG: phage N-6-adenine-methyltransferase [Prevotella sp.]|jgi:hypothetical protein|nr:phage N-6-adenine-methyltransferase [Prevotella sp.]